MDHNPNNRLLPQRRQTSFDPEVGSIPINRQWVLAIERFDGTAYLLPMSLSAWDFNEQALHRIYGRSRHTASIYNGERWLPMPLTKTVVGTARVKYVMPYNLNSCMQLPISLQDFEQNSLLTEVYQNPMRLLPETAFLLNKASFAYDPPRSSSRLSGQDVIVLRRILDKEKATWILVCLLIISPALGTLTGILSHRADVGVAVGAGIFALASFFQGLVASFP